MKGFEGNKPYNYADILDEIIGSHVSDIHTAMPAVVESFDASTQLAKVSPSIRRIFDNGKTIPIPPIIDTPICYPNAGGWAITFPVEAGDECLVVFSERAISTWMQSGGVQDPQDRRKHDYTDAIAILGIRSNPRKLSGYSSNSLQIRSEDGETYIDVTKDAIELEINGGGVTLNKDGSVMFANGAQITALGDFITATGKSLMLHIHSVQDVTSGDDTKPTTVPV